MRKEDKVAQQLAEEKAKRDASYEYGKDSKEPVASGAFRGALSSSLLSRIVKTKSRGKEAAILATGTAIGALAGKKYNDKKVEEASKARRWLADNRKEKRYIQSAKDIYKESAVNVPDDAYSLAENAVEDKKPKKRKTSEVLKDSLGGAALGAGLGLITKGKFRGIAAKRGAALGGIGTAANDVVDNASGSADENASRTKQILGTGASFAASGAIEPGVNRLVGYSTKNKGYIGSERAEYNRLQKKPDRFWRNKSKPDFLIGADAKNKKDAAKALTKGLGKNTLKAAGKFGLAGLGVGVAIDQLSQYLKKRELKKESSIKMSSREAIRAKTHDMNEILNSNMLEDAAVNMVGAGLGYGISRKLFGPSASDAAAVALGLHLAGKTAKNLHDRYKAKKYLDLPYAGKLSDLKNEIEDKEIGASDIYKAVVLNRALESKK